MITVFPSPEIATDHPWCPIPTPPEPTSLGPCWLHTLPLRVYTHAAPVWLLSRYPPTIAVFPSAEIATEYPWFMFGPTPSLPTSLCPCCVHTAADCVKTHAAPVPLLSALPPMIIVVPSAETATPVPSPGSGPEP